MDHDITDGSTELRPYFSYFHDPAGTRWEPDTDYADEASRYTTPEHTWQHSMGDIVNALVAAGLRIDFLHEFPYCVWKVVAFTEPAEGDGWRLPSRFPRLPMMFSIKATKPIA